MIEEFTKHMRKVREKEGLVFATLIMWIYLVVGGGFAVMVIAVVVTTPALVISLLILVGLAAFIIWVMGE